MTLSVTPTQLTKGGTAEVCISGGAPSTTITVEIDNGGDGKSTVDIETDASGGGCADWDVPASGWDVANFNFGDCTQVSRFIV